MKVALAFYGQPRFCDNKQVQSDYLTNVINKYDTTVFAHAWYSEKNEYDVSSWSGLTTHGVPDNPLEIIQKVYSPRLIIHDSPMQWTFDVEISEYFEKKFGVTTLWNKRNYSNLISQLWSIQRISDYLYLHQVYFKEKFDWIILARYDTILYNFPNLEELDPNKFYLPDNHRGFPDMISIFSPKFLSWSRNVYFDISDVYKDVVEPTPEAFKHQVFLKRFSQDDLFYHPIRAFAVRGH